MHSFEEERRKGFIYFYLFIYLSIYLFFVLGNCAVCSDGCPLLVVGEGGGGRGV